MTQHKVSSRAKSLETLSCDAGWRNYHYVKLATDDGLVGWSEFDEGFGSPGISAVIERLAARWQAALAEWPDRGGYDPDGGDPQ